MDNTDLFVCIDHVGLAVPDLDAAIAFHTDVLGWRVLHRETNEEQGVEEAMIGTGDQLADLAAVRSRMATRASSQTEAGAPAHALTAVQAVDAQVNREAPAPRR